MTTSSTESLLSYDHAPSRKFVAYVIEQHDGPISRQQLLEETRLPETTLKYALMDLHHAGVIDIMPVPDDARQRRYTIAEM